MICLFFVNDPATTEIYTYSHTLSLHYALPISAARRSPRRFRGHGVPAACAARRAGAPRSAPASRPVRLRRCPARRSEEHTSELQSLMRISYAVFCLKKKKQSITYTTTTVSPNCTTHLKHTLYHTIPTES